MANLRAVIFDLDDTLYDEIDFCKSGFTRVAEHLAVSFGRCSAGDIFDTMWKQFNAGNRTTTFNAALDVLRIDYDEQIIRTLVELYRSHVPSIALPPDSRYVLEQLKGRYILGLLTDGFLPAQRLKVAALRVEDYFSAIVYTEDLGRECWKPSPAGFERLLAQLGVTPNEAAYVADNEQKDFIAPNKLGLATIQLTRPARLHTDRATRPDAAPKHRIGTITELPGLLGDLQNCRDRRLDM